MSQRPLFDRLFEHLHSSNDRLAFQVGNRELSYAEIDDLSRRFAAALLASGVMPGERVACLLSSCSELITGLLGSYLAGAVFVPINTRYRDEEVRHILTDCTPALVLVMAGSPQAEIVARLTSAGLDTGRIIVVGEPAECRSWSSFVDVEPLEGAPSVTDEDIALLIYTSGTTGRSKGVELPFRSVAGNILALTSGWRWSHDDVLVLALPLFHVHGLCIGVHGTLLQGCTARVFAQFEPQQVADAIDCGGTIFMGVPTMYALLAKAMDADPSVATRLRKARLLTAGSAALSVNLFERFESETGHRILERYGMSETLITLTNPHDGERRRGSVGRPVEGVEARVVDDSYVDIGPGEVGQILIRGQSLFRGYWGQPEKTAESFVDGWFITGDAATVSEDGYISIIGRRATDIIKSGGYKISAREIEETLEQCAEVTEVAVVGVPDDIWGERIEAFVVPVADVSEVELNSAIRTACDRDLADFKKVRRVHRVETLPRNALGKIQKGKLLDR
jgi:acyl-CoA synthetase (AMP-forming)/AMP-acid ligase II